MRKQMILLMTTLCFGLFAYGMEDGNGEGEKKCYKKKKVNKTNFKKVDQKLRIKKEFVVPKVLDRNRTKPNVSMKTAKQD